MADRQITINVRAITNGLSDSMGRASSSVKKFESDVKHSGNTVNAFSSEVVGSLKHIEEESENVRHLWRSMAEAFISYEILDGFRKMAEGAEKAQHSLEIAADTAKNFGHELDPNKMESFVQALARSAQGGGYAIEQLRDGVQQFTAVGANAAQTQRALADAADLAAARNMDFSEAVRIISYAMSGHIELLSRYGINVKDATGKTVDFNTAMQRIEERFSGAAAKRAEGMTGAIGRLGTSFSNLRDAMGRGIEPIITAIANALDHLAEAINKVPEKVIEFAGAFLFVTTAATAVSLMLPAIAKGFQFLKEGVELLLIPVRTLLGLFAPLGRAMLFARIGALDLAAAEVASMLPLAAWIAGIASAIVIIDLLTRHFDHVGDAFHKWTQYMSDAWSEFTTNLRKGAVDIGRILNDVANMMSHPMQAGVYFADLMNTAAPKSMAIDAPRAFASSDRLVSDIEKDVKGAFSGFINAFKGMFGNVNVPHPSWAGLGGTPTQHAAHHHAAAHHAAHHEHAGNPAAIAQALAREYARDLAAAIKAELTRLKGEIDANDVSGEKKIAALEQLKEANRHELAMREAQGKVSVHDRDEFAARNAAIEENIARIKLETAERDALIAAQENALLHNAESARQLQEAQRKATEAHVALQKASNVAAESLEKLANDPARTFGTTFGDKLKEAIAKAVPGLEAKQNGMGFSMNWASFLIDAVSQTRAFGDIMRTVTRIVQVVARVFEALRPIIDLFLDAIRAMVNIFIFFYNAIARILRLLGIHIQLLQTLNSTYGDGLIPLIQITHNIPTLNELASGKVGPLSLVPQGLNNINATLNANGGQQIGLLGQILGALLAIKVVLAAEALFKKGGGIFDTIAHFFDLGGGSAASAASAGPGAAASVGAQVGADAVQQGIAADGASTSGGLFTSMSSALKAAGPTMIAAAAGFAIGSLLEPGRKFAGIGGGAGAAIGFMLGGPVGAAIGAVAGTLFGGLFGGPKVNAKDNPDLAGDVGAYGRFVADMTGGAGTFGGQTIGPDANYAGSNNMAAQMVAWAKKNLGNSLAQQILSLGSSASDLNITNEHQGMFTLGDGKQISVSSFMQIGQAFQSAVGGLTSFTDMLHQATDVHAYLNQLVNGTAASAAAASSSLAAVASAGDVNITHNVTFPNATIHGGNVAQLGRQLADEMTRQTIAMKYELGRAAYA